MSLPPPIPGSPQRGVRAPEFWSRNWKWIVPGIGLALFLVLALVVGALVYVITGAVKSSDVYSGALHIARSDTRVMQALGTPIDRLSARRQRQLRRSTREAHFSVGLHGPRGQGSVQVDATRRHGRWTYQTLTFASAQADPISLLPAAQPPPCQP